MSNNRKWCQDYTEDANKINKKKQEDSHGHAFGVSMIILTLIVLVFFFYDIYFGAQ